MPERISRVAYAILAALEKDSWKDLSFGSLLMVSADANRGESLHGQAYDRYLNSIAEAAEAQGIKVEFLALPFGRLHGPRAVGDPKSMNRLALIAGMRGRVPGQDAMSQEAATFDRILSHSRPMAVFAIGAPPGLCKAGRKLGIPVIEVLHAHGYPHFDQLGRWSRRSSCSLPTHVLSFDQTSSNSFRSLESQGVRVLQCADPWWGRFAPSGVDSLPPEWVSPDAQSTSGPIRILFSSQPNPNPDEDAIMLGGSRTSLLPNILLDCMRETGPTHEWLVRIHPVLLRSRKFPQMAARLRRLEKQIPNFQWEWPSSRPIFTVLRSVGAHITMSSTTAYECANAGVSTLLLDPRYQPQGSHSDWFEDLIEAGFVERGSPNSGVTPILDWIAAQARVSHGQKVGFVSPTIHEILRAQSWT